MGGNYEKNMYNQLCELLAKVDSLEADHKENRKEIRRLNNEISSLNNENRKLRGTIDKQNQELTELNSKYSRLREENRVLRNDNERMKRILGNDSNNSSKPPSSDKPGKSKPANSYNSREKTKRSVGAQSGHKGKTISKNEVETLIRANRIKHEVLKDIGNPERPYVSRYLLDLQVETVAKEIRIHADEKGKYIIPGKYRADVSYGVNIKSIASMLFCEGVVSIDRIADFINGISGQTLSLSSGTVYNMCSSFSELCKEQLSTLNNELLNAEVLSTDATYLSLNGRQTYIRNFSIPSAVLYTYQKDKNIQTLRKLPVISDYTGILVHDHETALYNFGTGHGECNVHLNRYLKKNTQESGNKWSSCLADFLCSLNRFRKKCISLGKTVFSANRILRYFNRYNKLIEEGWSQNMNTKNRLAKKEEAKLLRRLEKYRDNHLLFITDFRVSFDNNMSERDLRKCKNHQKMSGGFRTKAGIEMYCRILSVIETIKRRKIAIFKGIKDMFAGRPVIV